MKLPLARVAEILTAGGEFDPKAVAQAYSIDSRTIQPGNLFFAVKGEHMDGHDFVQQALELAVGGAPHAAIPTATDANASPRRSLRRDSSAGGITGWAGSRFKAEPWAQPRSRVCPQPFEAGCRTRRI